MIDESSGVEIRLINHNKDQTEWISNTQQDLCMVEINKGNWDIEAGSTYETKTSM
jgi:hypothetical protein